MTHRRIRPFIQANQGFDDIKVRTIINNTIRGQLNNVSEFYLRKDGTSTTISDDAITTLSMIDWSPRTAEAAAKLTGVWYSSTENGRVIMNHASTSTSDVLYDYNVMG